MQNAVGAAGVAGNILSYLADHPDAEDTLDGIVEWWLMRQRIRQETARVKHALSELVSEGFVIERRAAGSLARYRVNKRKLRAIRAYLKSSSRKEKG